MINYTQENEITEYWKGNVRTMSDMQKEIDQIVEFQGPNNKWAIVPAKNCFYLCIVEGDMNILFDRCGTFSEAISSAIQAETDY